MEPVNNQETNDSDNDCTKCVYAFFKDTGYSNWTVEGTDIYCILDLNPNFPVDKWYNQIQDLTQINCETFIEGQPTKLDVDRENGDFINYVTDPTLRAMIRLNPKLVEGI